MFFKIYKVKTGKTLYPDHHIAFAAILGEDKDGKRELFYASEDFTTYPYFHQTVFHDKTKVLLEDELRSYGYTPLPDKLGHLESQFQKKIKYAVAKNIKLTDRRIKELADQQIIWERMNEEREKMGLKAKELFGHEQAA